MIAWLPAASGQSAFWLGADLSLPDQRRRTVLLVEDDVAIANMYRYQLAADGFRVFQAYDGEQGLSSIHDLRPDLVLLDIRLPRLEGFAVLERMQASPSLAAIPVLILSNFAEPAMLERGLALGAVDYLIKSRTTPVQLSMKVRALLGSGPLD